MVIGAIFVVASLFVICKGIVALCRCKRVKSYNFTATVERLASSLARYAGVSFIIFLVLSINFNQTREIFNAVTAAQNPEQGKFCYRLVYRAESASFSAGAMAFCSIVIGFCWYLIANFLANAPVPSSDGLTAFGCGRDGDCTERSAEVGCAIKPFLVYSKYNS